MAIERYEVFDAICDDCGDNLQLIGSEEMTSKEEVKICMKMFGWVNTQGSPLTYCHSCKQRQKIKEGV